MNKFFKIEEKGSTIKAEIIGGITTFLSMSYILAVQPAILSDAGMDPNAVFTATILSAIVGTLIMGLYANMPLALASGMGINAFFTYTVVLSMGYTWQTGLFSIFVSGILFLIISLTGLRAKIINVIPNSLKYATSAGIGMYIAFIGLKNVGIIVSDPSTFVTLGDITQPTILVAIVGIIVILALTVRDNNIAVFAGMVVAMILSIILQFAGTDMGIVYPDSIVSSPPSIEPIFGHLFDNFDPSILLDLKFWTIVFSFLFIDFFDTAGTLIAVGTEANLIDKDGNINDAKKALFADAAATTAGTVLGTTSVTTFVESLAGVKAGARTGLAAVVVCCCFAISLFFSPLLAFITNSVTAPALVAVGALMCLNIGKVNFTSFIDSVSAFFVMLFMLLTYSIANGIAIGFIMYTVLKLLSGEKEDLSPLIYVLSIVFIIYFII